MIVKVHRPTHILADEGLHAVSTAEAARLVAIGAADLYIEPEPLPLPEPEPDQDPEPVKQQEKPAAKKKTARKKKTAAKQ